MIPRRALWWGAGAFLAFLVVSAAIPATRARQDRVAVLTVVLIACGWARYRVGVGDRPEAPEVGFDTASSAVRDEQDVRLARLDASLSHGAESGEQFARATVPMLRRLATQRLRDKAGIDVATDPAGARRHMGEELWEIFATPPDDHAPPPGPARLRVLVERLERL